MARWKLGIGHGRASATPVRVREQGYSAGLPGPLSDEYARDTSSQSCPDNGEMECARVSIVREREEQVSLRVIPQNPTIKQLLTATPALPILALRVAFWHGYNRHDLIADSRSSTVCPLPEVGYERLLRCSVFPVQCMP